MRKAYCTLLLTGIVCAVFSFLLLYFCFDYGDKLLGDALIAIFTGCIFAAPSSLSNVATQSHEIYEEEAALAALIAEMLMRLPDKLPNTDINLLDQNFVLEMQANIQELGVLALRLGKLADKNHLVASKSVTELLLNLYDIRSRYEAFFSTKHIDIAAWNALCNSKGLCLTHCERIRVSPFFH